MNLSTFTEGGSSTQTEDNEGAIIQSICVSGTCFLDYAEAQQPEGYFNIFFIEKVFSAYDDTKVSFSTTTQDRILSGRVDDHDKMYEIGCSLSKCDCYRLFSDNPLHMGFFLDSISGGEIDSLCVYIYLASLQCIFQTRHIFTVYIPVTITLR